MNSGSKKGNQIYFSFLSKVPVNEPPSGSPAGPLWRGRPVYRAFFLSLNKLIFRVPQYRNPPPRFSSWNPSQRDAPPLEPSFIHLSKTPVYQPPPTYQVPLGWKVAPMERDARIRRLS